MIERVGIVGQRDCASAPIRASSSEVRIERCQDVNWKANPRGGANEDHSRGATRGSLVRGSARSQGAPEFEYTLIGVYSLSTLLSESPAFPPAKSCVGGVTGGGLEGTKTMRGWGLRGRSAHRQGDQTEGVTDLGPDGDRGS